jgi:hypothetical protein
MLRLRGACVLCLITMTREWPVPCRLAFKAVAMVLLLSCRVLGSRRIVGLCVTGAFRTPSACYEGEVFFEGGAVVRVRCPYFDDCQWCLDGWLTAFTGSLDAWDAA